MEWLSVCWQRCWKETHICTSRNLAMEILVTFVQLFCVGLWELLYADDLVITAETGEEATNSFNNWKRAMEKRGLKVNLELTYNGNQERLNRALGDKYTVSFMWFCYYQKY